MAQGNNSKNIWFGSVNSDPKRQFRFAVNVGKGKVPLYYIKTATKPKASVSTVEHSFLDYTFKYPGRVTWDNITLTLIDPISPDLARNWMEMLLKSGYAYPEAANSAMGSMSKEKAQRALNGCSIQQLDDLGNPVEEWTLVNAWIVSIDFGGTLDYSSDDLTEISVEIAYDYATVKTGQNGALQKVTG